MTYVLTNRVASGGKGETAVTEIFKTKWGQRIIGSVGIT